MLSSQKESLEMYLKATGGILPDAPDGPYISRFDALELAQALERELIRGAIRGQDKIRVDMSKEDAHSLACFLRRGVEKGA